MSSSNTDKLNSSGVELDSPRDELDGAAKAMDTSNSNEIITYSNDEDFDELRNMDETTEITAYVDEIHAPASVGKKTKFDLFKFVLNNGSAKRIVCLVWGKQLITKYQNEIIIDRILHIEGAVTKAVSMNYYKETNNYVPFELLIQNSTTVEFLGYHKQPAIDQKQIQNVTFADVGKVSGLIAIEGYIKMKFVKTANNYRSEIYGCGSITDGQYKITVHIANYTNLDLEKGVFVKVIGEIQNSGGPLTLVCRDQNAIIPIEGAPKMTSANLSRGIKTPKRGAE